MSRCLVRHPSGNVATLIDAGRAGEADARGVGGSAGTWK